MISLVVVFCFIDIIGECVSAYILFNIMLCYLIKDGNDRCTGCQAS
jgi:hypothetical protein